MKTMRYLLAATAFLMLLSMATPQVVADPEISQSAEEWELIYQQDGIEFYVTHRTSKVSDQVNTVIKVKNSSDAAVFVNFTPAIRCGGSAGETLSPEKANLNPSGDTALFNFKACSGGAAIKVEISNVTVQKSGQ